MDFKGATSVTSKNHAKCLSERKDPSPASETRKEASRNMFVECQTKSKALEKSIVARICRKPGLGLLDPLKMD